MHKDIGDLIMIGIIFLIVGYVAYRFIRAMYLHNKYLVCPKCGYKTKCNQEVEYTFGDQDTYEVIQCTNFDQNCGWKYKFKY